jgi:Fur family iron response transcriptional regulator
LALSKRDVGPYRAPGPQPQLLIAKSPAHISRGQKDAPAARRASSDGSQAEEDMESASLRVSEPDLEDRLRRSGLRPTRQRIALADLIFAGGNRHLSAEELHEEALASSVPVSLATIYNTLHQFTQAGLLRIIAIEGSRTYFDTNTADHHHFFVEGENRLVDIMDGSVAIENLPEPPEGMEIANIDIVVRLRRKPRS